MLPERTLAIAREAEVCRSLMTVPSVGAIVSLTCRTGVDDFGRFARPKALGADFGLTPKRHESGEAGVRTALYEAANVLLTRVALARKLSVVLHRIWVGGPKFCWGKEDGAATAAA